MNSTQRPEPKHGPNFRVWVWKTQVRDKLMLTRMTQIPIWIRVRVQ